LFMPRPNTPRVTVNRLLLEATPANAAHLRRGIAEAESDQAEARELLTE
jgi:hypothetical protein